METILRCPVCGDTLTRTDRAYVCAARHSFDIARQGYVNLLLGKGASHGDNAMMLEARRAFLEAGHYRILAEALAEAIKRYASDGVLLDVGCGECYYTAYAADALRQKGEADVYAFDVSKDALRIGNRRACGATLFVASAYSMPVATASVDTLMLFFSPFCREEISRVLKKGGVFLMAIPGKEHLWGLKSAIYETPYKNAPHDPELEGFTLLEDIRLSGDLRLTDSRDITALFSMTPYYYNTSPQDKEKVSSLSTLDTQIEFHLLVYQKNG